MFGFVFLYLALARSLCVYVRARCVFIFFFNQFSLIKFVSSFSSILFFDAAACFTFIFSPTINLFKYFYGCCFSLTFNQLRPYKVELSDREKKKRRNNNQIRNYQHTPSQKPIVFDYIYLWWLKFTITGKTRTPHLLFCFRQIDKKNADKKYRFKNSKKTKKRNFVREKCPMITRPIHTT